MKNKEQFPSRESAEQSKQAEQLSKEVIGAALFQLDRNYNLRGRQAKFSELFANNDNLLDGYVYDLARQEAQKGVPRDKIQEIYQQYLETIDELYDQVPAAQTDRLYEEGYFPERMKDLAAIIDFLANIREQVDRADREQLDDNHKQLGIIEYELLGPSIKDDLRSKASVAKFLEQHGASPYDDVIKIHFPALFKQQKKDEPIKQIKESLTKLAELIVDQYPQTQGVFGVSWLLDNQAINKLLGFKVIDYSDRENWNQLVDQQGQIHQGRLSKLIKSGQLPMKNVVAGAGVAEFLHKFLPPDKRGLLTLKKIDPQWAAAYSAWERQFKAESKEISKMLDGSISTQAELEAKINDLPTLREALEQSGALPNFIELMVKNNFHKTDSQSADPLEQQLTRQMDKYLSAKRLPRYIDYSLEVN